MPATNALASPLHSARDRLLDAALELFATRGFQAIGLRDLASHVGLHAGSLYHHFENKQSLLYELIESALTDLLSDTVGRIKGIRSPGKRLNLFIQAFTAFNLNEKYRLTLITHEFANLDQQQQLRIIQLKNTYSSVLRNIIAELNRSASKPAGESCPSTSAIILVLFGQTHWYALETRESQLSEILLNVAICIISNNKKPQSNMPVPRDC
ncbi:TetR/AcrR family transcriptional regulator [Pseudomonas mandelii]|uniref:TetR/AcrR family transcriptional regulator n=1 Tax=Pseudomonas mandelii TaxID=75612 RepID=UPI00224ACA04|nr:TetR/AcrR family transcriptional regulator [Pseudomonas mandelii]MCX2900578.1 TetR/AcrR family transcriptional regulator [Pseudomonas mandelii]